MMTARPFALAAIGCALAMSAIYPAFAGNGWNSSSRGYGHHHYQNAGPSVGYSSPVTDLRRIGTFSRSVWVINRNGSATPAPILAPKATIIHVDSGLRLGGSANACSYEAGVCVIRGN